MLFIIKRGRYVECPVSAVAARKLGGWWQISDFLWRDWEENRTSVWVTSYYSLPWSWKGLKRRILGDYMIFRGNREGVRRRQQNIKVETMENWLLMRGINHQNTSEPSGGGMGGWGGGKSGKFHCDTTTVFRSSSPTQVINNRNGCWAPRNFSLFFFFFFFSCNSILTLRRSWKFCTLTLWINSALYL